VIPGRVRSREAVTSFHVAGTNNCCLRYELQACHVVLICVDLLASPGVAGLGLPRMVLSCCPWPTATRLVSSSTYTFVQHAAVWHHYQNLSPSSRSLGRIFLGGAPNCSSTQAELSNYMGCSHILSAPKQAHHAFVRLHYFVFSSIHELI
jgi:hypothetical protein